MHVRLFTLILHVHLHSCDDITGRIESCIILLASLVTHTGSTSKAVMALFKSVTHFKSG